MPETFSGRHYETGTVANALQASGFVDPKTGKPYSEALALGASGGIAFGYFVFEYKGHLPHVALLTRNTFKPFERALDHMAVRREVRETVQEKKADENLRKELDMGNPVVVWADVFSMPYRGLCATNSYWHMQPLVVTGWSGAEFTVVDGNKAPQTILASDLLNARGRVKKDRFRMMVLQAPDPDALPKRLLEAIEVCCALFLDKPPAGSANNFGAQGMRHWASILRDPKGAKSWAKTFEPGPRLVQALAGAPGQPGVWDWIETWGTSTGGDRAVYAQFLREASEWCALPELVVVAKAFDQTAALWTALAEAAMPDEVEEFKELKTLKRRISDAWYLQGATSLEERIAARAQIVKVVNQLAPSEKLAAHATRIKSDMAERVDEILAIEEPAIRKLRVTVETHS